MRESDVGGISGWEAPMLHVERTDTQSFAQVFVEDRTRFFRKRGGQFEAEPVNGYLLDQYIEDHLAGRFSLAAARSDATRVLTCDVREGRGPEKGKYPGYDAARFVLSPSLVFCAKDLGRLTLVWLLREHVPTEPALRKLFHVVVGAGAQASDVLFSTEKLNLPLGAESVLVQPVTLEPIRELFGDVGKSIEFIATRPRIRSCEVLTRPPTPNLGYPLAKLSAYEMEALESAAGSLPPSQRKQQLKFLVDVVLRFKQAGEEVLPLDKRTLVQLAGSHSGSYAERLAHAISSGILAQEGRTRARLPRRFRLLLGRNSSRWTPATAEGLW